MYLELLEELGQQYLVINNREPRFPITPPI